MDNEKVLKEEDTEKVTGGIDNGGRLVYTCFKCNRHFQTLTEYAFHVDWHEKQEQQQQQP